MREIASIGVADGDRVVVGRRARPRPHGCRPCRGPREPPACASRFTSSPSPAGRPLALEPELRAFASSGITDFYVYDSTTTPDTDWRALNERLSGVRLFANTSLPGKALAGGFAGLYTYDVYIYDGSVVPAGLRLGPEARPALRPVGRARATTPCGRPATPACGAGADGATYDRMWRGAIRAAADVVTITSYNEWHEGTQIEPAQAVGAPYASYDGAYGLVGRAAQRAYLDRTAVWARRYRERIGR